MTNVSLVQANPMAEPNHWANTHSNLRRAFQEYSGRNIKLVEKPDSADIIFVCSPIRNPYLPLELIYPTLLGDSWMRSVIISTHDTSTHFLPGIYTNICKSTYDAHFFRGGIYPHVVFREPMDPFKISSARNLYSFVGDMNTHEIRKKFSSL
jgi:hypothetical protein